MANETSESLVLAKVTACNYYKNHCIPINGEISGHSREAILNRLNLLLCYVLPYYSLKIDISLHATNRA